MVTPQARIWRNSKNSMLPPPDLSSAGSVGPIHVVHSIQCPDSADAKGVESGSAGEMGGNPVQMNGQ